MGETILRPEHCICYTVALASDHLGLTRSITPRDTTVNMPQELGASE